MLNTDGLNDPLRVRIGSKRTAAHSQMTTRPISTTWLRAALLGAALFCTANTARLLADDPKPDPAGTATGMAVDAQAPNGTFIVTPPSDLSADDKKDKDKLQAYNDAKKASDEYTAQARTEPLAVKLADSVGHNRVAINFTWTLMTGFLVMFMQAGFALVETGLCRAKNSIATICGLGAGTGCSALSAELGVVIGKSQDDGQQETHGQAKI